MSGDIAPVNGVQFVREWTEESDHGDEWPAPPAHVDVATGELADRVRKRFGVSDPTAEVLLVSSEEEEGYSEWTVETDYWFTVKCGGNEQVFSRGSFSNGVENGLVQLLDWLDGAP